MVDGGFSLREIWARWQMGGGGDIKQIQAFVNVCTTYTTVLSSLVVVMFWVKMFPLCDGWWNATRDNPWINPLGSYTSFSFE